MAGRCLNGIVRAHPSVAVAHDRWGENGPDWMRHVGPDHKRPELFVVLIAALNSFSLRLPRVLPAMSYPASE